MRKKCIKKVLALALSASLMSGALAGCGNTGSKEGSSGESPVSENSESIPEESSAEEGSAEESTDAPESGAEEAGNDGAAGMESWTAFADNVTLKVPVYDRGQEGIPDVKDNYWTKWVQENFGDKYNITVQYIPITRSAVETDYALLASGNNLPTILMEYDYPKLAKWAGEDYLATFDMEEFKQVAPNYYQQMEDNDLISYSELNGATYFAEALRPYYNTMPNWLTFYRMDWLRQIGYDHIPIGREEEIDVFKKLQEAGIAEHPAGGGQTGLTQQVYAERPFPMDELEWAMYGDFSIPSLSWGPNKEAIRYSNYKYNEGFTDPEYYVIDGETAKANFLAGKTWCSGAYMAADMELLNSFYAQNPDAELAVFTEYGEERKLSADPSTGYYPLGRSDNGYGMLVGFASTATEDEIKAAWMYMEWMMDEEVLHTMQWGVEGETYVVEDGIPTIVSDYDGEYKMGYNNNKDYWCIVVESRNIGDAYDNIEVNSPKGYPQDFTDQIKASYDLAVKRVELGYSVNDALFGITIKAEDEYRVKLQELFKEYHDRLVMCAPEEFDALYDQLAQEYLDAGYQEVLDERKAAYEAGYTTHLPDIQRKK